MSTPAKVLQPPVGLNVSEHISLSPYSSWKVGGTARWFSEPGVETLPQLMGWAHQEGIPTYFLGRGSNVLISDEGLPGLVIVTRNSMIGTEVVAVP